MRGRRSGFALIELTVAVGVLAVVMAAFAVACHTDQQALRANYYRAIAIEIVDGEMEALVAGEWRAVPEGAHAYPVRADAARNLPDGRFTLTLAGRHLRLEWAPARSGNGGCVVREAEVR
ncbi:MAG TPA: prepilin-type N-terminal cleavage/methylation domain-containing protein [Planctomycetota bacterium]|nr:prepilin-type N-terminal cleavage/methylation domain-containing protein [Planctomycetota bacterium]